MSAERLSRIEFSMELADSRDLIRGTLALYNENRSQIFGAAATSGLPGYQGSDDTWKRGQGPIPAVPNLEIETQGIYLENAAISGEAFKILPERLTHDSGVTRGDFNIYYDAGSPGTFGGIALLDRGDFDQFRALMAEGNRQGVAKVSLLVNYERGNDATDRRPRRAVFSMRLRTSTALLTGSLFLYNEDGEQVFEGVATSGLPRFQTANHCWTRKRGPIPPLPNLEILTESYFSEALGGRSFYIRPETFVSQNGGGTRSAFRVHYDQGIPGSMGCVVIRERHAFSHFCEIMRDTFNGGLRRLPLKVEYD